MRKLILIVIFLTGYFSKVQSQVVDILDKGGIRETDTYYKDINNLLNPFEGTYIYSNGNTIFKVVLTKKVQQYNGRFYEDLIIGEYQYTNNGVEIANTLTEINTIYNNQRKHSIDGNALVNSNHRQWQCSDCSAGEKRLRTSIRDVVSSRYADLIMRRTTEGGQEVMKIKITNISRVIHIEGQPTPPNFALPTGEFTLIKQ